MTRSTGAGLRVALVVAAALVAHGSASRGTFHYDDFHQIVRNAAVHDLASIPRFFHDPATFDADPRNGTLFRPLTLVTYALDWRRGGGGPGAFLATQVALHALAAALVLALLDALVADRAASLVGALVFAAHPLAAETVNLASARAGALAAPLVLAYLALRLRAGKPTLFALVPLALAPLAKESAVVAPVLALVLGAGFGKPWRRRLAGFAPDAAVIALFLVYRGAVLGGPELGLSADRLLSSGAVDTGAGRGILLNLATQSIALCRAVGLAIVPVRLSADHAIPVASGALDPRVLASLAALGALAAAVALRAPLAVRRGAIFFVVAAATTLLVPLNVVFAEERYYLSLAGVSLAAAGLASAARFRTTPGGARLGVLGASAALLLLAARSVDRASDFRSERRLWSSAVAAHRAGPRAHLALGNDLLHAGETEAAVASYRLAADTAGSGSARPFALLNLSEALRRLASETGDASVCERAARVLDPLRAASEPGLRAMAAYRTALVLADRYERFGERSVGEAAWREYRAILDEHPDEIDAWRGLARVGLAARARATSVSTPAAPAE